MNFTRKWKASAVDQLTHSHCRWHTVKSHEVTNPNHLAHKLQSLTRRTLTREGYTAKGNQHRVIHYVLTFITWACMRRSCSVWEKITMVRSIFKGLAAVWRCLPSHCWRHAKQASYFWLFVPFHRWLFVLWQQDKSWCSVGTLQPRPLMCFGSPCRMSPGRCRNYRGHCISLCGWSHFCKIKQLLSSFVSQICKVALEII